MTEPAKPLAERLLALEAAVAELARRLDELAEPGHTVGAGSPRPDHSARPGAVAIPASRGKS